MSAKQYMFSGIIVLATILAGCHSSLKEESMVLRHEGKIIYTHLVDYAENHGEWPETLDDLQVDFKKYDVNINRWNYTPPLSGEERAIVLKTNSKGKGVVYLKNGVCKIDEE
jgi:hypothetical protein